jgi:hypothetical protein
MSRPTNLYPERPKLEHFLASPTGLKAFTDGPAPTNNKGAMVNVASSFQKLNEAGYAAYLAAHTTWLNALDSVDQLSHEHALRRRMLDGYREVLSFEDDSTKARSRQPIQVPHYPGLKINVTTQKKVVHEPVLSTQPHQAEKRANRKKARDARVKVQANVAEAKAELLLEKTVPVIKAQRKAVEEVTAFSRLHKAEETAAKSAVVRATAIKKSSPDLVPEVKPDEGWKLVTRKKGANLIQSQSLELRGKGTNAEQVLVHVDPGVRQTLALAAIRAPTSTGKA